jgi:hypothetical protein
MGATPPVVRRMVASDVGGAGVVEVVVVVVVVVEVVFGEVGSGIDSGPSPGEQAARTIIPTSATLFHLPGVHRTGPSWQMAGPPPRTGPPPRRLGLTSPVVTVLRVALAQLNPTVGDLDGNLAKMIDAYDRAEAAGCDIIAFPELSTTGYPPEDLVLKPGFVADNLDVLARLASRTGRCAAIVGFVEHRRVGQQPLVVATQYGAVRADGRGVVEIAVLIDETDDRRAPTGSGRQFRQHVEIVRDEPRLEHEILGRVPRRRQLGKGDDVAAGRFGAVVGIDHLRQIPVEVTHGWVELSEGDSQHRHEGGG